MLDFAIVIPNFNQSNFLPSAIESIKYQSPPINLAIMDGGSTDNFIEVIEQYSDIITLTQSGPDNGQASAIKEGEEKVPGDIVAWLNADDYYFPKALDKVSECFEKNSELDVVYGDAIHVTAEGFFISYFPPIQNFNIKNLTRTCFICQPACFVRRSAYERVGGLNPDLQYTMDWDLWCKLAMAGAKFHYLPELLAAVRYYPGTKTLSGNPKRYFEIWDIEKKYGKRILPSSWPGSFLYELKCKKDKSMLAKFNYTVLNCLKNHIKRNNNIANNSKNKYGIDRWDNCSVGTGTLHLPWYNKQKWKTIHLRVKPDKETYRITINDDYSETALAKNNLITINSPLLETITRTIKITCLDKKKWQLLELYCDLEEMTD